MKKRKRSSLGSVSIHRTAKSKAPQYVDGAKKGLAIVGGLLGASVARGILSKVLPTTATGTGVNTQGLIVDFAITGAGVFLSTQSNNELLKYAGYGVAANGVAGAIKSVTGKDLLSTGLSGLDPMALISGFGEPEPKMQMIDLSKLPAVSGVNDTYEDAQIISGLYDDMGEVGAVEELAA